MITEPQLKELLDFKAPHLMLSVYLNTDPSLGNAESYKLRLRNLLKNINLPEDNEAVNQFINNEHNWAGRSLAIFSCKDRDFFESFTLQVPVKDLVHVSERPSVRPLTNVLENYGRYGVILVDKQGARLFHFHLGELQEQEGFLGEMVKKVKRGSASSFPGRRGGTAGRTRAQDELVERNMRDTANFAVSFFEENKIRRILIGGSDDNIAMLLNYLPKSWQSLIVGTFAMGMNASHGEVLDKALEIGLHSEMKREIHLVNDLITSAKKMNNAVLGLEDTLAAVNDNKVGTLVIAEDYHTPGYRCAQHGLMATRDIALCEDEIEAVSDVVDLVIGAVLMHGGEVEVVHTDTPLLAEGSIGAYLRY